METNHIKMDYQSCLRRLRANQLIKRPSSDPARNVILKVRAAIASQVMRPRQKLVTWFARTYASRDLQKRFTLDPSMKTATILRLAFASKLLDPIDLVMNEWNATAVKRTWNERVQDFWLTPWVEETVQLGQPHQLLLAETQRAKPSLPARLVS